jgi:LAS superfamily LD-carboxypeptidase LdcB
VTLTAAQLTGRDDSHLVELPCGQRLHPAAAHAFDCLRTDAQEAGFELAIASSFRSFDRQLAIFNGKASGQRPVHDDRGEPIEAMALSSLDRLHAILRFSALPGGSRHHWGTDLDVFDAAALPKDYRVQLTPAEVAPGGLFDPLHKWLDERMARGMSHGFHRPYAVDRGGVACERWHLSYAPQSSACDRQWSPALLLQAWSGVELLLREEIEANLESLLARYIEVPGDWCPDLSKG